MPGEHTTAEAARILGVSVQQVRYLCGHGRLGHKVGRDWIITDEDLADYRPNPRGGYHPRKRKEAAPE